MSANRRLSATRSLVKILQSFPRSCQKKYRIKILNSVEKNSIIH